MINLLVYQLSILGFGQMFARLLNDRSDRLSFRYYLGFLAIPILLFVLNVGLGLGLTLSARIIFAAAIVFLAIDCLRNRPSGKALLHPCFVLPLLIGSLVELGNLGYTARHWDEFSHWLLMPKQMTTYNQALSDLFPFQTLATYSPGWSLWIAYPTLVLGSEFSERFAFLAAFISAVAVFGLFFDLLKYKMLEGGYELKRAVSFSWLFSFIIILPFHKYAFALSTLIEPALIHLTVALLLLSFPDQERSISRVQSWVFVTVALTAGYLFKKPFAVFFITGLLSYLCLNSRRESKKKSRLVVEMLLLIIFPVAAATLWSHVCSNYAEHFSLPVEVSKWQRLQERSSIIPMMFEKLLQQKQLYVMVLAGAVAFFYRPRFRPVIMVSSVTAIVFFVGLAWTYIFLFNPIEGLELASFNRYANTVFVPCMMTALAGLVWVGTSNGKFIRLVHAKFSVKVSMVILLVTLVCFFASFVPGLSQPASPIGLRAQRVSEEVKNRNLPAVKIHLIDQGGNGLSNYQARFWSFDKERVWYTLPERRWSYGPTMSDQWVVVVPDGMLEQEVLNADMLWIEKSDDWLEAQMTPYLREANCRRPLDQQLIVIGRVPAIKAECIQL